MAFIGGQWAEFVMGSDTHGDQIDPEASKKFLDFVKAYQPQILVHGGDLFDLRPFRKGASEEERRESLSLDLKMGMGFLESMMEGGKADKRIFLEGNHDDRLRGVAGSGSGPLSDYATDCLDKLDNLCRKLKIKRFPYDKRSVYQIGELKMLHGMFSGQFSLRNTAAVYGSCLTGHVHSIAEFPIPGLTRRVARSIGCLCKLDPEYASRRPSSLIHSHGWAWGAVNTKTGLYFVNQAENFGGIWNYEAVRQPVIKR